MLKNMKKFYKLPEESDKEVSEIFIDSLRSGGSAWQECQCGKEHMYPDSRDLDEEDFANMKDSHARNPEKYILHYGYDSVEFKEFNGRIYVIACDCYHKEMKRYEDWIWDNRAFLREYLKLRTDVMVDHAESEQIANKICGI